MVGRTEKNSEDIKVTVIVPIHNSEKYLRNCLKSAMSQTFRDIEILCIDSGTTDLCSDMIHELQRDDSRIVYIRDSNTSYGHKLNIGVDAARGEYIAILESDDQMDHSMVAKLYHIAEKYHVDVVDSNFFYFFTYKGRSIHDKAISKFSNPDVYECLISNKDSALNTVAMNGIWTGLYRKDFLLKQDIRLNESPGASYQDTSFIFLTGCLAETVYHLKEPLYWYRIDNTGSSVKDNKKIYEIIDECRYLKKELERHGLQDPAVWNLYYIRKYSAYYWNYCRLSQESRELFLERYLNELRTDVETGVLTREIGNTGFYNQSFLLIDNLKGFKERIAESDTHKPLGALCEILDRIGNREIVVFGAGILGKRIIDILSQNGNVLLGICDNAASKHGTCLGELEIRPVEETVKKFPDACYLIVNHRHSKEMEEQLLSEGIAEANIEVFS